jgi:hypothetical protein
MQSTGETTTLLQAFVMLLTVATVGMVGNEPVPQGYVSATESVAAHEIPDEAALTGGSGASSAWDADLGTCT